MKRLLSYSVSVLVVMCLALVVTTVRAQLVPRTVLLEEGTNWSCVPCAQANPGVEAFLQSHGDSIIQIAYHPNWPGADDPMYMNDTRDNQGRVSTYYGVTGVPAIMIDGSTVSTSPASYEQAFSTRIAKLSPVVISVSRSVSGTTVTVTATVNAVADVSSYKKLVLRVEAVQRYMDTVGHNGEKRFMNPMRTMMPLISISTDDWRAADLFSGCRTWVEHEPSTTARTNEGSASSSASLRSLASRRQVNSC